MSLPAVLVVKRLNNNSNDSMTAKILFARLGALAGPSGGLIFCQLHLYGAVAAAVHELADLRVVGFFKFRRSTLH